MLAQIKGLFPASIRDLIKDWVPESAKQIMNGHKRESLLYSGSSTITLEQRKFWRENGYLVLPKMFDETRLDQINSLVDQLWASRKNSNNPLVIDIFIGTPNEKRILFRDAPDEARRHPYKLNDLFLESELVRETITYPTLCRVVADLLEGDPLVCNSLTFERSSQQRFHFDTFYMAPPVLNRMVASWVALEDCHENSGPLVYYPGSHLIPPYYFSDGRLYQIGNEMDAFDRYIDSEIKNRDLKSTTFPARKGDVLIWHAQLYHGGSPIKDMSLTRKSLVTHYFRTIDFPASDCEMIAPGRHYLKRIHQKV